MLDHSRLEHNLLKYYMSIGTLGMQDVMYACQTI